MCFGVRLGNQAHFFFRLIKLNVTTMDKKQLDEIIDCLPKERTLFHYFKGRYALMLLQSVVGEGRAVSELKQSGFASLLDKPEVKQVLAQAGQGVISARFLDEYWLGETYAFVLTLGRWGGGQHRWAQTSRRGYNLVLQMNFSNQHDGIYRKMVKPEYELLLNTYAHPVLRPQQRRYFRETLAWSRIDLDFATNEALIEEVQNDWLREAKWLLRDAKSLKSQNRQMNDWWDSVGKVDDVIEYCERVLRPYYQIWDEAMLSATIDFIHRELGISNVYYHTEHTGYRVKHIKSRQPPRSIYSKLPKRFCFKHTSEAPGFLRQDKSFMRVYKKVQNPGWFHLSL